MPGGTFSTTPEQRARKSATGRFIEDAWAMSAVATIPAIAAAFGTGHPELGIGIAVAGPGSVALERVIGAAAKMIDRIKNKNNPPENGGQNAPQENAT